MMKPCHAKSLFALALAASLTACAAPEEKPATLAETLAEARAEGRSIENNVGYLGHMRVDAVDHYHWRGQRYVGEDELIRDLETRMAGEIAAVIPETEPSGKTLRVVLPAALEAERGVGRFYRRLDELRLDALRKSAVFAEFQVEDLASRDPDAEGRDFVLYRYANVWRLKDGQGRMIRLPAAASADIFVTQVKKALEDLSGDMEYVSATDMGKGVVFSYHGKEYGGLRGLTAAFDSLLSEEQKRVVGVTPSLADKALVVLPRHPGRRVPVLRDEALMRLWSRSVPGFFAYERYRDRRIGNFIAASGLFKTVRVVTDDQDEPRQDDYDWVFWHVPGQKEWFMRGKDGVVLSAVMPATPESFAEDLRTKLTPPR